MDRAVSGADVAAALGSRPGPRQKRQSEFSRNRHGRVASQRAKVSPAATDRESDFAWVGGSRGRGGQFVLCDLRRCLLVHLTHSITIIGALTGEVKRFRDYSLFSMIIRY